MIKSLFDADEDLTSKEQKAADEAESIAAFVRENTPAETSQSEEKMSASETVEAFKIPENAKFFRKEEENLQVAEENPTATAVEQILASEQPLINPLTEEIKPAENISVEEEKPPQNISTEASIGQISAESTTYEDSVKARIVPMQTEYNPPSTAETIRRSGLAWSAGIVLFGSIVFMLIVGWFVDLILGSSPIGIVGGIVLGSIIGFVQFFRITSQIFKNRQ